MKTLSLEIPKEAIDIYNDTKCIKQILPDHEYMLYWKADDGSFKKTSKYVPIKESIKKALDREINISKYLDGFTSPYINIPNWYKTDSGTPVITQKYLGGGDLLTYLLENPNKGLHIGIIFLKCIREIIPILYDQKIYFGDFSLENFMVEKDNEGNLKKIILVDFGQAEIYTDNQSTIWKPKQYKTIRPYFLHPDIFSKYGNEEVMLNQDKFQRLFKKDMFVIGVLLYMIITGEELWDPYLTGKILSPEDKKKKLTDFRTEWRHLITSTKMSKDNRVILTILDGLLNPNLDNIISILDLIYLINFFDKDQKKRDQFSEDTDRDLNSSKCKKIRTM
tara:strand:- start:1565 stop:2569 length:1005 start_codon:yes stop_codon:yes gene_type:complete